MRPEDSNDDRTRPGRVPDAPVQPKYFDVGALFDGTLPETPIPEMCPRDDGIGLFYRGQYNAVFGDPEGGKTLLTDHATEAELAAGGRVLRIDLDHNGPQSTVGRLVAMGARPDVLRDPAKFLYIEPDDRLELLHICAHMKSWRPTLVILDSIGELLPLFGSNSNSADEFTMCHRAVIKPLVRTGACVVGIDHLSKGTESRSFGPGGTIAKIRAIGGTSIRVKVDAPFTPGKGGSAYLSINKDRHGGLRANSPVGDKEPLAGKFILWPRPDGGLSASVKAATEGEHSPDETAPDADIAAVAALDPPAESANDARARLKWRAIRARAAYKAWREQNGTSA
ncbi:MULTISPECIES: AAA family ATPase [Nocardia]|uniref:recombinase RecA n=1 Tax=Nocardia TaxID=1817 RepID=UPI000D68A2CA|nr:MULTISPECIES: recombinase RecA [Nocardia]